MRHGLSSYVENAGIAAAVVVVVVRLYCKWSRRSSERVERTVAHRTSCTSDARTAAVRASRAAAAAAAAGNVTDCFVDIDRVRHKSA